MVKYIKWRFKYNNNNTIIIIIYQSSLNKSNNLYDIVYIFSDGGKDGLLFDTVENYLGNIF